MSSRVVSRVAPKYVQALLRPATPLARPTSSLLMSHAKSSSQQVAFQLASAPSARFFSDKTTTPPPPTEEEKPATEDATEETAPATEEAEPEVNREEQLEEDLKAAKDQLLRSLAEQENTRRIAKRDVQDARNFAVKSFAKSLLEVSDNLSRALEVVPEELRKDTENNPTLATLYEGIEMTETGLMKAFESNGLKKFGTVGDVFDPNKHEALYEYPDAQKTPGTVGQVIKIGFLLNDRVLRPAEVGVVKKE
ncbi:Protein GrpE [Seminavis robusta]|uniref:GrpE protein homolog n=1 Tax=Seminavis robusta TaxID=568900 RepID=A0A9N8HYR7_9STRA|nr:Protein GrpE [Seminavis robusta]|eukprot:Sro2061_g312990.1 Protein GrpE (251) ;mRNA; f:10984-11736